MANKLIVDWLSVTFKTSDAGFVLDLLGMRDVTWEDNGSGAHGYQHRQWFEGVNVFTCPSECQEYKIWLEMSGSGCRAYETYGANDWDQLLRWIRENGDSCHVSRIDIAYDDMPVERDAWEAMSAEERAQAPAGILDIGLIADRVQRDPGQPSYWYLSVARAWNVERSDKGTTVYVGSAASNVRVRIYDKSCERGCDRDFHWVRVELVLRDDNAIGFIGALGDHELGEAFGGVLITYLRFVEPDPSDSNRSRWEVSPWWRELIQDAERLRIASKPGTEYNVTKLLGYVCGNMGNAVNTAIQTVGLECFLDTLEQQRPKVVNEKYKRLMEQVGLADPTYDFNFWLEYKYRQGQRFDAIDQQLKEAFQDYHYRQIVEEKLREQGKPVVGLW